MSTSQEGTAKLPSEPVTAMEAAVGSSYNNEPENWLSRGIGIFLGLAVSAAAVGGVVSLLHMHVH